MGEHQAHQLSVGPTALSGLHVEALSGHAKRTDEAALRIAGRLGVALLLLSFAACNTPRQPNVLLFTFDTTRADFLGCYGKESARTPNLDRLAEEGVLFENAMASNPVTQAAHSTVLTGTYPMAHGVRDNLLFKLSDDSETLAELLSARGYATAAAIGGFPLVKSFGSAQGFDFYDDDLAASRPVPHDHSQPRRHTSWYDERPAGHVNDAILPWLRQHLDRDSKKPFFIWLHYWDPHEPHIPPAPYDQLFAHDLYQGEIAYADESLGTILRELRERGELERTVVVMTGDHGEGRMEHNEMTHAFLAYSTTLHVPLIIRAPGLVGGVRIQERVGTVDIVPTILDLLGFESPETIQGRSLVPLMEPGETSGEPPLYYSESLSPRLTHGFGELRVLYKGSLKYIYGPRPELYDLQNDPFEREDLSVQLPDQTEAMRDALARFIADRSRAEAAGAVHEVEDETRRRLEALGYFSTESEAPEITESLAAGGIAPQDRVNDINLAGRLRRLLAAGHYLEAKRTATKLLTGAPQHAFYRGQLAAAHLGLGELDEAEAVARDSEVTGGNLPVFLDVADALFEAGQKERAVDLARRLANDEDTLDSLLLLTRLERQLGDSAVEQTLSRAHKLDAESPELRLEEARWAIDQGDLDRAEQLVTAVRAEYPIHLEASLMQAEIWRSSAREGEALALYERLRRLYPASCELLLALLQSLTSLERRDEALDLWNELPEPCRDERTMRRVDEILAVAR